MGYGRDMDLTSTERLSTRNRRKASTISNSILHEFSSVTITETAQDEPEKEEKFTFKEAVPQIGASISATSFHIIVGVTFAATATLLPQVVINEKEPNEIMATNTQAAWIASMFVVSVPFASLFSGYIMDKIGRLNTVKISIIPAVGSCIAIAMAQNVYVIIAGRCLMGIATAFGVNPAVVYITETTSSDYRGPLVSAGPTLSSLGMMLGYLLGALLDWRTVSYINISFCVIPLILIILFRVPESPAWLLLKGREDDARTTLEWISRWKTIASKQKFIEERLTALRKETKQKGVGEQLTFLERLKNLKKPTGYRPLIIFLIFFTFQQYCGVYISTVYAVQFFKGAGSSMNPFYASVLIGLIRFLGSLLTTVLLKHCRRRSMCLISCAGMAINMAISGYYTNLVDGTEEGSMVPVYCILIYVGFSMIGLLSLPWTMAAEVFPNEIRAIGHGLVVGGGHLVMFLSIQTFFDMVEFFGGFARLQWFFAIMSVLAMIFIYFCLPETHDRELADITEYFENNTFYPGRKKKKVHRRAPPSIVNNGKELKPKTAQGLEALTEYDTLMHREEEQHASILPKAVYVGNTDTSTLEFIDKSMELLSGQRDEPKVEIVSSRSAASLPEVRNEQEK